MVKFEKFKFSLFWRNCLQKENSGDNIHFAARKNEVAKRPAASPVRDHPGHPLKDLCKPLEHLEHRFEKEFQKDEKSCWQKKRSKLFYQSCASQESNGPALQEGIERCHASSQSNSDNQIEMQPWINSFKASRDRKRPRSQRQKKWSEHS